MAVRRARFFAAVRTDLLDILVYIADTSGSVSVAESFVKRLRDRCHQLAALESVVGRPRPELRSDVRSVPFLNYVIFFRYVGDLFEVVAILERHRDIDGRFASGGDAKPRSSPLS